MKPEDVKEIKDNMLDMLRRAPEAAMSERLRKMAIDWQGDPDPLFKEIINSKEERMGIAAKVADMGLEPTEEKADELTAITVALVMEMAKEGKI